MVHSTAYNFFDPTVAASFHQRMSSVRFDTRPVDPSTAMCNHWTTSCYQWTTPDIATYHGLCSTTWTIVDYKLLFEVQC